MLPWILIGIVVLALLVIFLIKIFREKKHKPDYYSFFVMGVIWLPMGIAFHLLFMESSLGLLFIALGIMYMLIGLAHKDKWKTNHKAWKQLSKKERRLKKIAIIVLTLIVFLGLAAYALFR